MKFFSHTGFEHSTLNLLCLKALADGNPHSNQEVGNRVADALKQLAGDSGRRTALLRYTDPSNRDNSNQPRFLNGTSYGVLASNLLI